MLLASCATKDGQTYTHYFYKSQTCSIGYSHTYGERIKGKNECFKNFRLEFDDSWVEGESLEGALVYRVYIDPDFNQMDRNQ
jgi:hypothetical protein